MRSIIQEILPLVDASRAGDDFTIMSILRASSPKLEPDALRGAAIGPVLSELRRAVETLTGFLANGTPATVLGVMRHVNDTGLLRLDERFSSHLIAEPIDNGRMDFGNVQALLSCNAGELWNYRHYIEEESPFATQQGIKGAQFDRVLVVLDDEEGSHSHFSYGKYFGYVSLSEKDEQNIAEGKDSVPDRTRRLFYVCCSRAVKDLAVVLFVPDTAAAREAIVHMNLFPAATIHGPEVLA